MNVLPSFVFAGWGLLLGYLPLAPAIVAPAPATCSLYQSEYPVEFTGESLQPFLADFKASTAVYDVVLIEIKGGRGLFYKRLSLQADGRASFYELSEDGKLKSRKRPYSSRITQLVEQVGRGHFSSLYYGYASEPSADILLVKKAGTTQFSYSLDRECYQELAAADKSKIAGALPLAAYLKSL